MEEGSGVRTKATASRRALLFHQRKSTLTRSHCQADDWNAVHTTNEPVEIVMDIPQELASLSADFYILRAHEGAYLLLEDLDDNPATITIKTEAFSTYAITYQRKDGAGKQPQGMEIADEEAQSFPRTTACSLCHICPTILGICCFIWLAVLVIIVALAAVFVSKKKHGQKKN